MCNFIYLFCLNTSISYIFSYIPNYIFENSVLKIKKDNNYKILYISHYIGLLWSSIFTIQLINYLYFYKYNLNYYLWNLMLSYYLYDLFLMIRLKNRNYIIHHLITILAVYNIIIFDFYNIYIIYAILSLELPTIFLNLGWIVNNHNKRIAKYIFIPGNIIYIIFRGFIYPYNYIISFKYLDLSLHVYYFLFTLSTLIYLMSVIWSCKLIKVTYKLIKN